MSGDRVTTGMDAVVVRVVADDGTIGIGESGTVGVTFDAQHLPGQLAGVAALAPAIVGADPRSPQAVHRLMTAAMTGHPYAKAPVDIAVWDLAARPRESRCGNDWVVMGLKQLRCIDRFKAPPPRPPRPTP